MYLNPSLTGSVTVMIVPPPKRFPAAIKPPRLDDPYNR
jgi:hypothetical protein